ncbi:molybdopterin synthase sulfur carrier subunit [Photobacterium halotolerans]|uniref:Molybdopterin synthase sulfur carrier subunit n=1 Tax=Photobacterium halotolerans TaxID=265726 RepID=A0A7X4W8L6_9GAMM|nr:molybdopterin synthase sulfur carrier subunit [Photobacterium halotolerans]NAW64197.1 molybdopterin synthase sulfur carrier subunit [Photobacterium halotolerans]NAW88394.1 molybdopterin synthase sulfur carrier subunit [Photobacterium halotolerans]NAX45742.1 molybdopterin synthase sulfur carrier subunit [Photobacterium halotolerans]
MIKVLFFAQVRELTGCDVLQLEGHYDSVEQLRAELSQRGERWSLALEPGKLLAAVNQTMVPLTFPLKAGDEVALFPPVTGG